MRTKAPLAVILAAAAALSMATRTATAADVVVGSDQKRTYDCAGGTATVEGGFNVVTFRNCATVNVKGGDNTIDAGLADTIEVGGADNRITWTERADGSRPRIVEKGSENVITSKRAPAGAARAAATPAPAPPRTSSAATPSSAGHVTATRDGVRVEGPEGTVTVGAGGTVTIREKGAAAPPAGGRVRVDGDGGKADHDCHGASALVNGERNDLTFENCDLVTVNGNANRVSVRGVAAVTLNGGDNTLTWQEAASGARPKITDNGQGNTVTSRR
jgi:hypothetical protein